MRFETHQRRIRAALKRFNDALGVAASAGVFVNFTITTSENNDQQIHGLTIRDWEVGEDDEEEGDG